MVVEDLHWSDGASRDVTEFVSRAVRSERLLLVVTARTDDTFYATVRPLLGELERIDHCVLVRLERLQAQDVGAMARALGAHDWSADRVAALAGRSDGVPYFVEELVRDGLSAAEGDASFADRAVGHRLAGLDAPTGLVVSLAALALVTRLTVSWHEQPAWPSRTTNEPSSKPSAEEFCGPRARRVPVPTRPPLARRHSPCCCHDSGRACTAPGVRHGTDSAAPRRREPQHWPTTGSAPTTTGP